jgi:hypothetical protein
VPALDAELVPPLMLDVLVPPPLAPAPPLPPAADEDGVLSFELHAATTSDALRAKRVKEEEYLLMSGGPPGGFRNFKRDPPAPAAGRSTLSAISQ